MAALSFVIEVDGFQHGAMEPFHVRCLAVACGKTESTYTRFFDTTDLLGRSAEAIWTYRHQTDYHGLPISSAGLPRELASTALLHAIQGHLLQLLEVGNPSPNVLILWTKGGAKVQYLSSLLHGVVLPIPFLVRNLEEVGCPPARQLRQNVSTTAIKARVLAEWLIDHLNDHAGVLHSHD